MDVYFSPLASSLASRIALAEADHPARFIEVDLVRKATMDGAEFGSIYRAELVPTIRHGELVLSENTAVLEYIARLTGRWPDRDLDAHRLRYWLGFIATEIHRGLFTPLFDDEADAGVRDYAMRRGESRLDYLDQQLDGRDWLGDDFSVADAYLLTLLHMAQATPVELARWPALDRYLAGGLARESVRASIATELPLYIAERKRQGKPIMPARPRG